MPLYTKSIQLPACADDGIRVCIMRRPGAHELDWHIWMPMLAPSHSVLTARHHGTMSKEAFNHWFHQHVITGRREHLELVVDMARNRAITLLCVELDPQQCHRKLVAEACQMLDATLEVIVR